MDGNGTSKKDRASDEEIRPYYLLYERGGTNDDTSDRFVDDSRGHPFFDPRISLFFDFPLSQQVRIELYPTQLRVGYPLPSFFGRDGTHREE
jgi:hypothetical protein